MVCYPLCILVCARSVVSDSLRFRGLAHQAPLSMRFFQQESWSGLPFPPPGNLPDPGIKPVSLMSPISHAGSLTLAPPGLLESIC